MLFVDNEFDLVKEQDTFIFTGERYDLFALYGMFATVHDQGAFPAASYAVEWYADEILVSLHWEDAQAFIDFLADLWENEGEVVLYNDTTYARTLQPVQLALDDLLPEPAVSASLWEQLFHKVASLVS